MSHQRIGSEIHRLSVADMASPEQLIERLNSILASIQLRQDRLEGLLGGAQIRAPLEIMDSDGNVIAGFTT